MGMTFPTFVSLYYKEEHRHTITYVHACILHFSITVTYPALRVTLVPEPKGGATPTLDAAPVYPQCKMAIYANSGILIQCNHTNVQIK